MTEFVSAKLGYLPLALSFTTQTSIRGDAEPSGLNFSFAAVHEPWPTSRVCGVDNIQRVNVGGW